jgi:DNA-directed RNA polymerases I, II, and III subunit RPABC2
MAQSDTLVVSDDLVKVRDIKENIKNYLTLPWMTKYEFDQVIGLRTMHLSKGAVPLVPVPEGYHIERNMELRTIAMDELRQKKLPYMIKRPLPKGRVEYWPVSELSLLAVEHLMH